ncbi:MAG TPA: SAP domain-containing protein [Chromatiales bacterium]|nr:SAP domain-containing protein [Chromatiales bacterium]
MLMQEIRTLARQRGIKPGKQSKISLVRAIQRTEGNFACFATAYDGECDQTGCLWRKDCFALARKGLAS